MEHTSRPSNHPSARPSSRMATTPQRRPSTSAGSSYSEPKSQYLQQALMERRSQFTPQPRDTTPRRPTTRGATPFRDEWTAAGDAPIRRSQSTGPQRPRPRRASDGAEALRGTSAGVQRSYTVKETNSLIDKLQKENFDLKLRITLQDERAKKLADDLDQAKERIAASEELEEKCNVLIDKAAKLEQQIADMEKEMEEAKSNNEELVALNEEMVKELEQRDAAVDEAAAIIHEQEERYIALQKSASSKRQPKRTIAHRGSDYFSAEADSPRTPTTSTKLRSSSSSGSSVHQAESDYYSATSYSSPASTIDKESRAPIRRPKPVQVEKPNTQRRRSSGAASDEEKKKQQQKPQQLPYGSHIQDHIPTRQSSANATASASNLLLAQANILDRGSPDSSTPRGLRRSRKTQAAAIASLRLQTQQQEHSSPTTPRPTHTSSTSSNSSNPKTSPGHPPISVRRYQNSSAEAIASPPPRSISEPPQEWNDSRPLRSLYDSGELNRPITADVHNAMNTRLRHPGEAPPNATPSVLDPNETEYDGSPTTASTARPRDRNSTGRISSSQFHHRDEDEYSEETSLSTATATITTEKERKMLQELGSEYSFASRTSRTAGGTRKYPPWPPSEGILQRDWMFRPG